MWTVPGARPVSSASSRRAASERSSSTRTNTPGSAHSPRCGSPPRRTTRAHSSSPVRVSTTRSTVTANGGWPMPPPYPLIVTLTIRGGLMADIDRRFGFRHLRGAPTVHIRHYRRGKLAHDGVGLSFWYRPLTAVVSEVPVDDRELPLLFHARTADFQDVTVQRALTFRIEDPALAAQRIDFSIDPDTGRWRSDPLGQISGLLTENVQQYAVEVLTRTPLEEALVDGVL